MSTMLIDRKTVDLFLADGAVVTVAADVADLVAGIDFEGDVIAHVAAGSEQLRLLTPCCNMPGERGTEPGGRDRIIVCSGCGFAVDEGFHPEAITDVSDVVVAVTGRPEAAKR